MRSTRVLIITAALLGGAQALPAQAPSLVLEARGGYAIPSGEWNEDDVLENGFGLGATVMAMVTPQMGVYAGYEAFRFQVDDEELGTDADAHATDAGFRAGISVSTPVPRYRAVTPFIEVGVLYNTLDIEASGDGTSVSIESEESLGFEAGVGFASALNERVSIVPMIRYRQHEVEFESFEGSESVQYIVVGVGLRLRL